MLIAFECVSLIAGWALCPSALRSQLGPLGQPELVFDPTLRTLDLRTMLPTAEIFFGQGAMRVKWFFDQAGPKVLAAAASGEMHLLEARGGMAAPSSLMISTGEGEQLCSLDVSATAQLLCAGRTSGCISICALSAIPVESLQANPYAQHPEPAEPADADQVPYMPLESPVGTMRLPPTPEMGMGETPAVTLASSWPPHLLGRRGSRTVDPEGYLRALAAEHNLPASYIAFGSVSCEMYRNTIQRPPNLALPPYRRPAAPASAGTAAAQHGGAPDDTDENARQLPAAFAALRRPKVPLGKFGLADDFSFSEHNQSEHLCALDNTVPNCYCNVALLMLYQLPWLRVHCLGSLMKSQFVLSDELGFLFAMMDRSRGAACQPRNFQRALHQVR